MNNYWYYNCKRHECKEGLTLSDYHYYAGMFFKSKKVYEAFKDSFKKSGTEVNGLTNAQRNRFNKYLNSDKHRELTGSQDGVFTPLFPFEKWLLKTDWRVVSLGKLNAFTGGMRLFANKSEIKGENIVLSGVYPMVQYTRFYKKGNKHVLFLFGINHTHSFYISVDYASSYMSLPIKESDFNRAINGKLKQVFE